MMKGIARAFALLLLLLPLLAVPAHAQSIRELIKEAAPQPAVETPAGAPAAQPSKGTTNAIDLELSFWNSIKDSANPDDFAAYLESYPNGTFAPLAKSRMASLKKSPAQTAAGKAEKKKPTEAVVLMPLRPTKDIPQDEMTQYEAALVKSLSERYVVYSGQRVQEKVQEVYRKRSAEAKEGEHCDQTKCYQDLAIEFQTGLVAIANIRKTIGGYSLSLTITDVMEDKSVFSEQTPCKGCDEFKVMEVLQTLAGGGAAPPPSTEAPAAQASKGGANTNDMEITFWNSIKDSANPALFEAYLKEYPNGKFAPLAKIQMAVKSPAQIAAEKAAAEKALADKIANPPEGMVFVQQGDGGFYMDRTEVTQEAYQRVFGSNPSKFTGCPTCPVEQVNWFEATAYCKKVGKRLPTAQEWEYSATSGGKKEEYAGTNDESRLEEYAWYYKNSGGFFGGETHGVGQKKPNGLGLYDMSGNVWEWTDSWHDDSKQSRVLRGGSWDNGPSHLRASSRFNYAPDNRYNFLGFRCSQ